MSLDVDADAWSNAQDRSSVRRRVLDHLDAHPDEAFHAFELCDELYGTRWSEYYEIERTRMEEGEDAIDREAYDEILDEGHQDSVILEAVRDALDQLLWEERVESRQIPVEETEVLAQVATIPFFRAVGDG